MDLLSGLIGTLVGALIAGGFGFWTAMRAERNLHCDEVANVVVRISTTAVEYWSKDFGQDSNAQALAEAKLRADNVLLDGIYDELKKFLYAKDACELDQVLARFQRETTGGSFSEGGRPVDLERLLTVALSGSNFISELRKAYRGTVPFYKMAQNFYANRNMEIDQRINY